MNNAEKFKSIFGLYATELWVMSEESFLSWLNSEYEYKDKRKKGKWVWEKKIPFERCRCSECGYCRQLKIPEPDYFCPNCGADMRGK